MEVQADSEFLAPVHTADAVQLLLDRSETDHLEPGVWMYFRMPFGGDATYQGMVQRIEFAGTQYNLITLSPLR